MAEPATIKNESTMAVRSQVTRAFDGIKRKRINYDDDVVVVYDGDGNVVYRGLEDYEPNNREAWRWDPEIKAYRLGDWTKIALDI